MIPGIVAQSRHLISLGPRDALEKTLGALDRALLGGRVSHARYQRGLSRGRVYLGTHLRADQGHRRRYIRMQQLALSMRRPTRDGLRVLEVGSYAGGSAIVWAGAIRDGFAGRGRVVCIDPWTPYAGGHPKAMNKALAQGQVRHLFDHNVRAAGVERWIEAREGTFEEIFPCLDRTGNHFDLIYVDGDHRYSQVIRDLRWADRLLAGDGIMCGDDLELQFLDTDAEACRAMAELDFVVDPRSGRLHHPGVTLAVSEFFGGAVSCWDGFWAMARGAAGGWRRVCP